MLAISQRCPAARVPSSRIAQASSLTALVLIAVTDALAPTAGLPVLYPVSLIPHCWVRKPALLWSSSLLALASVLAVWAATGQSATPSRLLAGIAILLSAGLLHLQFASNQHGPADPRWMGSARHHLPSPAATARRACFLTAAAHDIRTPANAISLMAEVIGRAASAPELAAQVLPMASKLRIQALAMVGMATDVLDILRLDFGSLELRPSEFCLDDLLVEECRPLVAAARTIGLELHQPPLATALRLRADRLRLARVIKSFAAYAVYASVTGRVEVTATLADDGRPRITIRSTGFTLAPDELARLFDEMFQLRNPNRERNQGTGLGLVVGKRLAECLGGEVTATSCDGDGTTFRLTLPASTLLHPPAA